MVELVRMKAEDIPYVMKTIEKPAVTLQEPWAAPDYAKAVAARTAFVASEDNKPSALLILEARPHYLLLSRILGTDAGTDALLSWLCVLALNKMQRVKCPVRESDLTLQLLLKSWDFKYTRTIADYFRSPKEPAYLFIRERPDA